jgi:GH15 family glucan-1,4-alpha-glucosidase
MLDLAADAPQLELAPLHRIDRGAGLEERIVSNWRGFGGDGPVRVGNAAALHRQHDVFGEAFLALAPIYFDDRLREERSPNTLAVLEQLATKAIGVAGTPDAGIWEYRNDWHPQTFSTLMCWAAADRMAHLSRLHRPQLTDDLAAAATRLREQILERAWNAELGTFVSAYGGKHLDAALLQMVPLRLLPRGDARLTATVNAIRRELMHEGWLYRYRHDDDFGKPQVAFVLCIFWLVQALAQMGLEHEARATFETALQALSPLGLLAEDWDAGRRVLCGNFPQAYSHVGLIHAAFAASPPWSDVL